MNELRPGEALLIARRRWGWTQPELAEKANVSVEAVKRIENGLSWARRDTIEALNRALEGELYRLLGVSE